jgi:galactokinase
MDLEARKRALAAELESRFGGGGSVSFFRSPGRVDLMGSHTDYNQGFILATTIDRDIVIGARPRGDGALNLYSLNLRAEVRCSISGLRFEKAHGWANYPKGVIKELLDLKVPFTGADLAVDGNIPVGGNLSSSAAIEAATCEMALGLAGADLPRWERVHLCHRAENNFIGLPCGIMDQFVVIMGGDQTALRLDCRSLEFESIPFALAGSTLAVIDSGLGRQLAAGKYAERVRECRRAVEILKRRRPEIESLRDASPEEVERMKAELGDAPYRRARHVLNENDRVLRAARAVKAGDEAGLGKIMEECYRSCRDLYENSIPALDELHDRVVEMKGVLGVRICGAGWGGCLLALVARAETERLAADLFRAGRAAGRELRTWAVKPTPGAGKL